LANAVDVIRSVSKELAQGENVAFAGATEVFAPGKGLGSGITTPLLHAKLLPDLMQVNVFPW
jgi:hypothetical protein